MGKCTAIIVCHGEFERQKYDDGPLTEAGRRQIIVTANSILEFMERPEGRTELNIHLALISGTIRGLDSYRILMETISDYFWRYSPSIYEIRQTMIDADFYSSEEEDKLYRQIYGPDPAKHFPGFNEGCKTLGSAAAIRKHAPGFNLIQNPANRVVAAIRAAQAQGKTTFLVVTHAGYEQVIVKALTGEDCEVLELGKHITIKFD